MVLVGTWNWIGFDPQWNEKLGALHSEVNAGSEIADRRRARDTPGKVDHLKAVHRDMEGTATNHCPRHPLPG